MIDGREELFSKRFYAPKRNNFYSAPICIQIKSTFPVPQNNVVIYGSLLNRAAFNYNLPFGSATVGVFATSLTPGITYQQLLANSENKPFKVGRTLIISSSPGQLDTNITITHSTDNGDMLKHVVVPTLDPFQSQTDRILDGYEYLMDGFGSITFDRINANSIIDIELSILRRFSGTLAADGKYPLIQY